MIWHVRPGILLERVYFLVAVVCVTGFVGGIYST